MVQINFIKKNYEILSIFVRVVIEMDVSRFLWDTVYVFVIVHMVAFVNLLIKKMMMMMMMMIKID